MKYYKSDWQLKQDLGELGMLAGALLVGGLLLFGFCGCDRARVMLAPPAGYQPGQMYGNSGATPCMGACGPVINKPKQWLKPCGGGE